MIHVRVYIHTPTSAGNLHYDNMKQTQVQLLKLQNTINTLITRFVYTANKQSSPQQIQAQLNHKTQ